MISSEILYASVVQLDLFKRIISQVDNILVNGAIPVIHWFMDNFPQWVHIGIMLDGAIEIKRSIVVYKYSRPDNICTVC